ncbi:hypothetical protein MMC07_003389 [Pseudocyphellaria aurata]|nr:hypothetical protein [Pseudocyphellaria aurata]
MTQEQEASLLDYARFHGLAHSHLQISPLANLGLTSVEDPTSVDLEEDPSNEFSLEEFNRNISTERLSFGKDAISVLSVVKLPVWETTQTQSYDEDVEIDRCHRWRNLKHELPLLRTDHELDMIHFRKRLVPDLENECFPTEAVDEEADEGFTWPSKYHTLPDEFNKISGSETLAVCSETLLYLRDVLRLSGEVENVECFDEVFSYQRVRVSSSLNFTRPENDIRRQKTARDPITPPLLPLSPPVLPFIPSSDAGRLELLPDDSSPSHQRADEINQQLNDEDAIIPKKRKREVASEDSDPMTYDIASVEDFYSPLRGIREIPSSPPMNRVSLQDRKVEVPLTPLPSQGPVPSKPTKGSFGEALLEIIPSLPPPCAENKDFSSDDIDTFFSEVVAPIGIKAARSIEQEQLQAADTELRVTVPIMDFSLPVAPWKGFSDSHCKNMLSEIKQTHLSKHVWPAVGKTERELKWNPIPSQKGMFEPQETLSDDGSAAKFLEQPECIDCESLTWKPEGLRILDELAESDEELDVGKFPDGKDLNSLIRRRIYELEADREEDLEVAAEGFPAAIGISKDLGLIQNIAKPTPQAEIDAGLRKHPEKSKELITQGVSPLDALENFMFIRKGESQKSKVTGRNLPAELSIGPRINIPQETPVVTSAQTIVQNPSVLVPPFPLPQFTIPKTSHPFVVSTSFLCNRKLARRVQQLHPTAVFIERDFTLHFSGKRGIEMEKQSAIKLADTMADEADMILSPSTGLILTTLQKIKQRSLPGQTARSVVREAIIRAAPRYERLLVLAGGVGNGESLVDSNGASSELIESDCEALVDFMGFCSNMQQDTQAIFIAAGEEQLAHWIVAMMVKHGVSDPQLKLLQDETLWEIFLRRAGMNAFAAQAILAELRAPDTDSEQRHVAFGLTAFVQMDRAERLARFEGILGGRGLIERVSKRLDARW